MFSWVEVILCSPFRKGAISWQLAPKIGLESMSGISPMLASPLGLGQVQGGGLHPSGSWATLQVSQQLPLPVQIMATMKVLGFSLLVQLTTPQESGTIGQVN